MKNPKDLMEESPLHQEPVNTINMFVKRVLCISGFLEQRGTEGRLRFDLSEVPAQESMHSLKTFTYSYYRKINITIILTSEDIPEIEKC